MANDPPPARHPQPRHHPAPLADGRTINIRKPRQPDEEQKRVYQMLGIDWESAFPTQKNEMPA